MNMIIINADDWGKNTLATDNTLSCHKNGRITSTSAMVFMADSERSAELALEHDLDVGLHLNFTLSFSGPVKSRKLIAYHRSIIAFLSKNKNYLLIYNPLLKRHFEYVYKAQFDEYVRLYDRVPAHINGHNHMHLCTNMLIDKVIPKGYKVRRNFSFAPGEKGPLNRFYRRIVDSWLMGRYTCTDFFFDIFPIQFERLQGIVNLASSSNVELMVHPEFSETYGYLMSEEYLRLISMIRKGTYSSLEN